MVKIFEHLLDVFEVGGERGVVEGEVPLPGSTALQRNPGQNQASPQTFHMFTHIIQLPLGTFHIKCPTGENVTINNPTAQNQWKNNNEQKFETSFSVPFFWSDHEAELTFKTPQKPKSSSDQCLYNVLLLPVFKTWLKHYCSGTMKHLILGKTLLLGPLISLLLRSVLLSLSGEQR